MAQRRAGDAAGGGGAARAAAAAVNYGYRNVAHGLLTAARTEGLLVLWRGLLPRLVLKSLGSSLWYSVYMGARRDVGAALLPMQAASEARAGGAPGTCAS